jgi:hypothetical protein
VKNLARLALLFSFCFAVLLLSGAGIRFLILRLEWVRTLPLRPETPLLELIAAARWALSLAVYGSVLLGLSYAARRHVFAPFAALCLVALPLAFCFGVTQALDNWENVPPEQISGDTLGEKGLILTNALMPGDTAIVLLDGPSQPEGPRVVAVPGRPLLYHTAMAAADGSLPPLPFRNETPWFLKSLSIDLRLNAEQLRERSSQGMPSLLIYAGALIFLLSSLGFILKLSAWPLANLFLGCLVFRGILALETFFNSPEMQDAFGSFLGNRLPLSLTVPLIFCALGLLIYLYSVLVYLANKRGVHED